VWAERSGGEEVQDLIEGGGAHRNESAGAFLATGQTHRGMREEGGGVSLTGREENSRREGRREGSGVLQRARLTYGIKEG